MHACGCRCLVHAASRPDGDADLVCVGLPIYIVVRPISRHVAGDDKVTSKIENAMCGPCLRWWRRHRVVVSWSMMEPVRPVQRLVNEISWYLDGGGGGGAYQDLEDRRRGAYATLFTDTQKIHDATGGILTVRLPELADAIELDDPADAIAAVEAWAAHLGLLVQLRSRGEDPGGEFRGPPQPETVAAGS